MKKDSPWMMVKQIILVILASLLFRLVVLWVMPDPSKPTLDSAIVDRVINTVDRYLHPEYKKGFAEPNLWEDSPVQQIRDELVLRMLSERALSDESKPPLPREDLFPPGKLDKQEKMRILERSHFYHELEKEARKEDRLKDFADAPGPKISDVKGGTVPLPEDMEAQRIITALKEAAKETAEQKTVEAVALGIKGPAASRQVSYFPAPLPLKAAQEGERLIKFWVLPDGTVAKAIPLVAGDTRITSEAITQIKRYYFAPLPRNVPQEEMWGIIPVKSVLR